MNEASCPVTIPAGKILLNGDLCVPKDADGLVVFAHGSGSSRLSPRNMRVAAALRNAGLGTLLFDLLTDDEEAVDVITTKLRFNIPLLSERLVAVTEWLENHSGICRLPIGYFGASTGAAAALVAAAELPECIAAVVSRGGRPDLAMKRIKEVKAPTLLIVGGADMQVMQFNRMALEKMATARELAIIPGATHLFEEPGAMEEVERLATAWFLKYLTISKR